MALCPATVLCFSGSLAARQPPRHALVSKRRSAESVQCRGVRGRDEMFHSQFWGVCVCFVFFGSFDIVWLAGLFMKESGVGKH